MKKKDIIICEGVDGEELFLKHRPKKFDYIIAREKLTDDKDYKIQRRNVINRLNKLAREKIDSNCYNYFADEHVIIIWENIKKEWYLTDYLGYSEEHLLTTISMYLKRYQTAGRIFIESPLVLTNSSNPSYTEILKNLYLIWKHSSIVPEFIKNDFLSEMKNEGEFNEELQTYLEEREKRIKETNAANDPTENIKKYLKYEKQNVMEMNKTIFLRHKYKEQYERFFRTIDALNSIIPEKITVKPKSQFIDLYLLWQQHKISGEEAIMLMGDCSRANWYRYVTAFEKSPVYENYTCTYFSGAYIEPKRGHVPNAFELISYYNTVKDLRNLRTVPVHSIKRLLYDKFDEIHAINDVYKCLQAAMHTIHVYKHKGVLKKKAGEYGLTEEDVYDTKYELWEPHKYDEKDS